MRTKFYTGGSASSSISLPCYIPFLTEKNTPTFVHLLLTNGSPFTYPLQNFASLKTAVNAIKYGGKKSQNQSVFSTLSQPRNVSVSPLRPSLFGSNGRKIKKERGAQRRHLIFPSAWYASYPRPFRPKWQILLPLHLLQLLKSSVVNF